MFFSASATISLIVILYGNHGDIMIKRIPQNHLFLPLCCLILASTQALADRPAMDERSEDFDSELIDISTDLEEVPVFEEMPVFKKTPDQENRPVAEELPIEEGPVLEELPDLEARPGREEVPVVETPAAVTYIPPVQTTDEIQPVIDTYNTETDRTGDVIELQTGDTLPVTVMDFPRRGMTMETVKNELGPALSVSEAIGKPPITTWTYSDRVIYFEYSHVVHVVAAY